MTILAIDNKESLSGSLAEESEEAKQEMLHRLNAMDAVLAEYPDKNSICFIFISVPSRGEVEEYQLLRAALERLVGHINGRHGTIEHKPIEGDRATSWITEAMCASRSWAFCLDYDGTVREFVDGPDQAAPTEEIEILPRGLSSIPKLEALLVSGRKCTDLDKWFSDYGITPVAEHGMCYRRAEDPRPYEFPDGTVAREATSDALKADGIEVTPMPEESRRLHMQSGMMHGGDDQQDMQPPMHGDSR